MPIFEKLMQRIEQRAAVAVEKSIEGLKQAFVDLPFVAVQAEAGRIILSGRRLSRRWLEDVRLRFAMRGQR